MKQGKGRPKIHEGGPQSPHTVDKELFPEKWREVNKIYHRWYRNKTRDTYKNYQKEYREKQKTEWKIYGLFDKDDNIWYIGVTNCSLKIRYQNHLSAFKCKGKDYINMYPKIKAKGLEMFDLEIKEMGSSSNKKCAYTIESVFTEYFNV